MCVCVCVCVCVCIHIYIFFVVNTGSPEDHLCETQSHEFLTFYFILFSN